jgi:intracellular sulfur oxidation DsrE/DsrF family protein
MKKIFGFLFFFLVAVIVHGQETPLNKKVHKIVFQLSTGDTLAHKALMKQINNITTVAPTTLIEVICHGPGLSMIVKNTSIVSEKVTAFQQLHTIQFYACEFSMQERKVVKENILPSVGFVPAGIIAIVTRQEEGWSYIKAGF